MTERDMDQNRRGMASSGYSTLKENPSAPYDESQGRTSTPSEPAAEGLRQKMSEDVRSVKQTAEQTFSGASDKARNAADTQKNLLAEKMNGVAAAMEKVAAELEQGDQRDIGRLTRSIGSSVGRFSQDIKDRDLGEVAGMAEDFGRKQPLAFLGMAAIAGLAASRFLMASSQRRYNRPSETATPSQRSPTGTGQAPSGFGTFEQASTGPITEGRFNG